VLIGESFTGIGLNCIQKLRIRVADSKLKGPTKALFVSGSCEEINYEFIFTSLVNTSPRLFTTIQAVHKAYETSRLYRELKLRGALITDRALRSLPDEEIYQTVKGVWNLSSDQGNLGTLIVTNIRLVWFADLATNFNVSIPYLQMVDIRSKNSKFGEAFVIEVSKREGGYVLGFKLDPKDKMLETMETVRNLHSVFSKKPNLGVTFSTESAPQPIEAITESKIQEDLELLDTPSDMFSSSFSTAPRGKAAYISSSEDPKDEHKALPVFCPELGLATQPIPPNSSIKSIWNLIS